MGKKTDEKNSKMSYNSQLVYVICYKQVRRRRWRTKLFDFFVLNIQVHKENCPHNDYEL